jgi:hypothetical protein
MTEKQMEKKVAKKRCYFIEPINQKLLYVKKWYEIASPLARNDRKTSGKESGKEKYYFN